MADNNGQQAGKSVVNDKTETVETLISDSRVISKGSQFGHVALNINNTVFGRAP